MVAAGYAAPRLAHMWLCVLRPLESRSAYDQEKGSGTGGPPRAVQHACLYLLFLLFLCLLFCVLCAARSTQEGGKQEFLLLAAASTCLQEWAAAGPQLCKRMGPW